MDPLGLDRLDHLLQSQPALRAEDFKEGGVGFKGRGVGRGLFNERQAKFEGGCRGRGREVRNVRVQSHAEEGGAIVDPFFEKREEGFHGFP